MRILGKLSIGVAVGITLAALMAPTGGLPSRPTFQTVKVGALASAPTVTGQIVAGTAASGLSASFLSSANGAAMIGMRDTSQAADTKVFDMGANGGAFLLRTVDDASASARNILNVTRTALAVNTIAIGNVTDNPAVTINAKSAVTASANQSNAGVMRLVAGSITQSAGGCSILGQTTGFTACTRPGAGQAQVSFTAAYGTVLPACVVSADGGSTGVAGGSVSGAGTLTITNRASTTGTATDGFNVHFICIGV